MRYYSITNLILGNLIALGSASAVTYYYLEQLPGAHHPAAVAATARLAEQSRRSQDEADAKGEVAEPQRRQSQADVGQTVEPKGVHQDHQPERKAGAERETLEPAGTQREANAESETIESERTSEHSQPQRAADADSGKVEPQRVQGEGQPRRKADAGSKTAEPQGPQREADAESETVEPQRVQGEGQPRRKADAGSETAEPPGSQREADAESETVEPQRAQDEGQSQRKADAGSKVAEPPDLQSKADAESETAEPPGPQRKADAESERAEPEDARKDSQPHEEAQRSESEEAELKSKIESLGLDTERLRQDRKVIRVKGGILFDPGSAQLKPAAIKNLRAIADVLARYPERYVSLEGYTDNTPIGADLRQTYPNNRELGAARAARAARFLRTEAGIDAARIRAVGYGAERPVASNDTSAGKARNRRLEILLSPQADFPIVESADDDKSSPTATADAQSISEPTELARLSESESSATSSQEARVFIHYSTSGPASEAIAKGLARHLREQGFTVADLRTVDSDIDSGKVRYFFERDKKLAERLLADIQRFLPGSRRSPAWEMKNVTDRAPRPSGDNIEVWIPDRHRLSTNQ